MDGKTINGSAPDCVQKLDPKYSISDDVIRFYSGLYSRMSDPGILNEVKYQESRGCFIYSQLAKMEVKKRGLEDD